jgi:integrase
MPRQAKPRFHKAKRYWRVHLKDPATGATIEHYLGTDETAAHQRYHALMLERGQDMTTIGTTDTLSGLIADWWTRERPSPIYRRWLMRAVEFAGSRELSSFHHYGFASEFMAYLDAYRYHPSSDPKDKRPLTREGKRHCVAALWRVFTWGFEQGLLEKVPKKPKLEAADTEPRCIPPKTLAKLLEILEREPDDLARLFKFSIETGCRPGEACSLRWEDLELTDIPPIAVIREHKTQRKTGQARKIGLTPAAVAVLLERPRTAGPVFVNTRGKAFTPPAFYRRLLDRCKAHGLPRVTPYQCRHTFAQSAAKRTHIQTVSALLGHTSTVHTQKYFSIEIDHAVQQISTGSVAAEAVAKTTPTKTAETA